MDTQAQDNFVTALDERIRRISREVVAEGRANARAGEPAQGARSYERVGRASH
jgi:hypothetical protein